RTRRGAVELDRGAGVADADGLTKWHATVDRDLHARAAENVRHLVHQQAEEGFLPSHGLRDASVLARELPPRLGRRTTLHETAGRENGHVERRAPGALVEDEFHLLAVGVHADPRWEIEIALRPPRIEGSGGGGLEFCAPYECGQDAPGEVLAPEDRDTLVAGAVAGVIGVGVAVVTLLVAFLDRVPAAALTGGALARIMAGRAAPRAVPLDEAARRAGRARRAVERIAQIAFLVGRIDDPVSAAATRVRPGRAVVAGVAPAVPVPVFLTGVRGVRAVVLAVGDATPVAVIQHGQCLDRLAAQPGPAARSRPIEVQRVRSDRRGPEGPLVVRELVAGVVRGQVRRHPGAEEHRVRAEDLEGKEIAGEAPRAPARELDRARIEKQRVVARRDRTTHAVGRRMAADDVLVPVGHRAQGSPGRHRDEDIPV